MKDELLFDQAVSFLGYAGAWFRLLMPEWKEKTEEIRLRTGKPVSLRSRGKTVFLQKDGRCVPTPDDGTRYPNHRDMQSIFRSLCFDSVYAHEKEIENGFLSLPGGHRAGICGTAVYHDGHMSGVRDIVSVNLRIAHACPGCAGLLFSFLREELSQGLLLAGPPGSGKTTLLRDLAGILAGKGQYHQVALLDERGELAAVHAGESGLFLGECCDILTGYPKAEGIETAIRVLAPEYIICDEIGREEEMRAIQKGSHAGLGMIGSVHASGREDFLKRPLCLQLLQTDAFHSVAFLAGGQARGKIQQICRKEEFFENRRLYSDSDHFLGNRVLGVSSTL